MPSSRGRRALLFTALAFLWSVALLVAALLAPVYGSATLVDENGRGVLLVVAVPAVITLVACLALWRKCSRGRRLSGYLAWACVCALALFSLAGLMSIGAFVLPVAVLLARAVSITPSPSPPAT